MSRAFCKILAGLKEVRSTLAEIGPVELCRETDGRWIADVPKYPGVMAYGDTADEAQAKAVALAFKVVADNAEEDAELNRICDERAGQPSVKVVLE